MTTALIPKILDITEIKSGNSFPLDESEKRTLQIARKLFDAEFYPQSLLEMWNASSNNIKRRIEAYGVELFLSVVKDESGRKTYNPNGDTLNEKWENVDDFVLIQGAKKLGLINKKASKGLETVNWMRSHASSAHSNDEQVNSQEVISLAMLLEASLFSQPLPDPGHSVSGLFKPVKEIALSEEQITTLKDQIKSFNQQDLRTVYGFLLDMLCDGEEPSLSNSKPLLLECWNHITEDVKKIAGFRYHTFKIDNDSDTSSDKGAKTRLIEYLLRVDGIMYVPDGARAKIYRKLAEHLRDAKDTSYGWSKETTVSKTIQQFGPYVPTIAFEEFYQEVLAVIFGNYWGRSDAHTNLEGFILNLNSDKLREIVRLCRENERVQEELSYNKPKQIAINLLNNIKDLFTIEANKSEVDECIKIIEKLK